MKRTRSAKRPETPPDEFPDLNALLGDEPAGTSQPPPESETPEVFNPDRRPPIRETSVPEGSAIDRWYYHYIFDPNKAVDNLHLEGVANALAGRHHNIGDFWLKVSTKLTGTPTIKNWCVAYDYGPNCVSLWVTKEGVGTVQLGNLRFTEDRYKYVMRDGWNTVMHEQVQKVKPPPHLAVPLANGTPPPGEKKGKDRWGFRLGTDAARINAVLTGEKKSPARIKKEAGVERNVSPHLSRLAREGKIVRTKKGNYYVKDAPAPPAPNGDGGNVPSPVPARKEVAKPVEKSEKVTKKKKKSSKVRPSR